MRKRFRNVGLLIKTKKRLDGFGNKGETYDHIVNRLLDSVNKKQGKRKNKK